METGTDLHSDTHHQAAPALSPVLWVEGMLRGLAPILLPVYGSYHDLPGKAQENRARCAARPFPQNLRGLCSELHGSPWGCTEQAASVGTPSPVSC